MPIIDHSSRSLSDLLSLRGKVAVVTGGGRGLGLAIAHRLAEAGAGVLVGDLDKERAVSAAEELAAKYDTCIRSFHLDVRSSASMASFADFAERHVGPIDIWVNNAGIFPYQMLSEMSDEDWDRVQDIDLKGVFLGCREAARSMRRTKVTAGTIINIASVSGLRGRAGFSHYCAAKHGVIGLTKSLAVELGPEGIRVLAVAPTLALTPGIAEQNAISTEKRDEHVRQLSASLPLGRAAVPDDVARVVMFCASDAAALMTGSTLMVDAGQAAT